MSEEDDRLREMAAHRGLKLVKSRRRKPGGDFGLYGLRDAAGAAAFGIDAEQLTASADEIQGYLSAAASNAWGKSAGSAKPRPKPAPAQVPKARAKPRFKVEVANLLATLPAAKSAEAFTELLARPGIRVERIVSRGQSTAEDQPMVQDADEWVLVLEGAAGIRIEDSDEVRLGPGDYLWIARGQKHWVTWTAKDRPTVWLAIHLD